MLETGSRVVVVLSVNKRPDRQINYGTGNAGKRGVNRRWPRACEDPLVQR